MSRGAGRRRRLGVPAADTDTDTGARGDFLLDALQTDAPTGAPPTKPETAPYIAASDASSPASV
jgi:hypothetical protein